MTKPTPSPDPRHRPHLPAFPSVSAAVSLRELAADRADGVSHKFPHTGLHGGEKAPEIYPVYQAAGQSSGHQVEPCEVCGKAKEDCAC